MKYLAPKWTTQWTRVLLLLVFAWPVTASAGFAKLLRDVPDHLGTGTLAIDHYWSVAGLIGFVLVVGLLVGFYRRDREE